MPTTVTVHLSGSVLWTQGSHPESQPYSDVEGNRQFLFNGDIYNNHITSTNKMNESVGILNDGLQIFNRLREASTEIEFLHIISELQGPFAFIYYERLKNEIWFGRDLFGRESLILCFDDDYPDSLFISSISVFQQVFELPTFGIFCYKISRNELTAYAWNSHPRDQITQHFENFVTFLADRDISLQIHPEIKLHCIPTLLRTLSDQEQNNIVLNQLISLTSSDPVERLFQATQILDDKIEQFLVHIRSAVKTRVSVQPPYCKICVKTQTFCNHSKIGILFSGGIDSMVLACLAAECLPPGDSLDLLNVAFYPDLLRDEKEPIIPDRETGLQAHALLKIKFPHISINFIPVNVSKSEVEEWRRTRIRHLISPLTSVLDDSIGCCLWFAAQGKNQSPARILLLGSGADELLGGYSRHRSAFQNGGWEALRQEMQLELDRISIRNLGRDNRVVSDHGVAPRMPFLDERVVRFLTQECDLWVKCCPLDGFKRGLGEKLLLRAMAMKLLGRDSNIPLFPKRAMQFGSRIAKLENSKEKAGDHCGRLNK